MKKTATDTTKPTKTLEEVLQEGLGSVAFGLKYLGNGDTGDPRGAVEFHAVQVKEAGENIARGLSEVAEAIRDLADAMRERKP